MTQNARDFEAAIRYEARRSGLKEDLYEDAVKREDFPRLRPSPGHAQKLPGWPPCKCPKAPSCCPRYGTNGVTYSRLMRCVRFRPGNH
ncbi:hypothetical protein AHiyo8_pII70320 (plasmid) [Arthrobacter sp. Hiyo8]|nr:hypothetical protein AHiyo8_pII70230 [Arthrobacter sp. Hiyo8]BAS18727.1 hypothetical protein AHiyo8_pII70320 [Arthrobacter sp. Hiyo8]